MFVPLEVDFPSATVPAISIATAKVSTDLPELSAPRTKQWRTGGDEDDEDFNPNHRGRAKVHALKAGLRKELLDCKSHKEFWDFVKKRSDARPRKAKVSLKDLTGNFEARLNYPPQMPASFNADQLAFNERMANELAENLPDNSPRQSYTRDITLEEIESMKRHIKAHGLDTA
ncbi:hypothetical protein C8R46DRAFT_921124, partial [Mycena filopes]